MKAIIAIALAISFGSTCHSQTNSRFHYKIKKQYFHCFHYYKRFDLKYTADTGKTCIDVSIPRRVLKANLLQDEKKNIIKVDFWGVGNYSNVDFYGLVVDSSHYFYFELPVKRRAGDVTKYISIPYATWEFGVTTIPFKYRFGNRSTDSLTAIPNETTVDVNAGIYVGRKWGRTRFFSDKSRTSNSLSYTFGMFASPMVIVLGPKTSHQKVSRESNELGIGTGLALMVAYRDINVGILGGFDIPVTGESSKWIYSTQPWIGFGIGYKLALLGAGK